MSQACDLFFDEFYKELELVVAEIKIEEKLKETSILSG